MNSYGDLFKITLYGGSHEKEIGILIEGVPSGIKLDSSSFSSDLKRRMASKFFETKRMEVDEVIIKSGVYNGYTTGSCLTLAILNKDTDSKKYEKFYDQPRPGHADFSQLAKSKYQNINGGGICSGRMTTLIVCAGVVSKKIYDFKISSKILEVGGKKSEDEILKALKNAKCNKDGLGGIVNINCHLEPGLGEPFFNSLESEIAHFLFSIPGVKGVEFGAGFMGSRMFGSDFNDLIISANGRTLTNNSGGINGGISNGNELSLNVAIRPPASIYKPQLTFNFRTNQVEELVIEGRHDVSFIYRSLVVLEAALNIVLLNFYLRRKIYL